MAQSTNQIQARHPSIRAQLFEGSCYQFLYQYLDFQNAKVHSQFWAGQEEIQFDKNIYHKQNDPFR